MANQNILSFYGSKLDLKVDYSELYDFELTNVQDDFDSQVLDFTTPINYTSLVIDVDSNTNSNYILYQNYNIVTAENNNKIKKQN